MNPLVLHDRIRLLQAAARQIASELEELIAWHEALSLAYTERTGKKLKHGLRYTAEDEARADEIMKLFPRNDA